MSISCIYLATAEDLIVTVSRQPVIVVYCMKELMLFSGTDSHFLLPSIFLFFWFIDNCCAYSAKLSHLLTILQAKNCAPLPFPLSEWSVHWKSEPGLAGLRSQQLLFNKNIQKNTIILWLNRFFVIFFRESIDPSSIFIIDHFTCLLIKYLVFPMFTVSNTTNYIPAASPPISLKCWLASSCHGGEWLIICFAMRLRW